ncbi:MAG: hypothetical protein WA234_08765, partial [Rectinemataceae bacterium]
SLLDAECRRLSSSEWIWETTPPFSVPLGSESPTAALRIEKGRIAALIGENGFQASRAESDFRQSEYLGRSFSISVYEELNAIVAEAGRRTEETL